jgi:serine/threonine protein kinase
MSDKPKNGGERTIFDPAEATQRYAQENIVVEPTVIEPTAPSSTGVGAADQRPSGPPAPQRAANEPRRAIPSKPAAPSVTLPIGFRLMEYRVDGILGQGGFGIAYAATDVNLNAKVVIKEYLPEDFAYRATDQTVSARDDEDQDFYQSGLDAFLVEARTLATFRHPNIVRVARFFEANRTAYMVLEYERGQSLKAYRKKHENIPESTLVQLFAPLLDGLAVVHAAGYLHRDIKPDNIYVRDSDGSLVLLDFGAARQTATEKAEIGTVVTPGYGPSSSTPAAGARAPGPTSTRWAPRFSGW